MIMGGASTVFSCILDPHVVQTRFDQFVLNWTNECPAELFLDLDLIYVPAPTFQMGFIKNVKAMDETKSVTFFYLNSVNRVDIKSASDGSLVYTTTFTSLAAPPVLLAFGPSFSGVGSRALSLQWDSDTMAVGPILKNPKGTLYEIQMSNTMSFDDPRSIW
ncbi:MAG: hypothetical protein IPN90_01715 [Elusimicrobia bacterium]|nr:hypothetical protein [Elusimicrobiota bacterium]